MNLRIVQEPTPAGRLAAVVHDEMYRQLDAKRIADYADFRAVLEHPLQMELLAAKLEEAQLTPGNDARIKELLTQLGQMFGELL